MDYLNQISADNRQAAKPVGSFFDSLPLPKNLLKWLGLAVAAVLLLVIVSALIPKSSASDRALLERINLRSTNLSTMISDYNPKIKSSRLRAITTNVSSVLTYNQTESLSYLTAHYGDSKGKFELDKALTTEEEAYLEEVTKELERGLLEGAIDRTYHRVMIRELSYLMNLQDSLGTRTKDADLISFLNQSGSSLTAVYTDLENFTDPAL